MSVEKHAKQIAKHTMSERFQSTNIITRMENWDDDKYDFPKWLDIYLTELKDLILIEWKSMLEEGRQ